MLESSSYLLASDKIKKLSPSWRKLANSWEPCSQNGSWSIKVSPIRTNMIRVRGLAVILTFTRTKLCQGLSKWSSTQWKKWRMKIGVNSPIPISLSNQAQISWSTPLQQLILKNNVDPKIRLWFTVKICGTRFSGRKSFLRLPRSLSSGYRNIWSDLNTTWSILNAIWIKMGFALSLY